jgi:hypothetical protein
MGIQRHDISFLVFSFFIWEKCQQKKRFVEHFGKMINIFFVQIQTKNVTLIKKLAPQFS